MAYTYTYTGVYGSILTLTSDRDIKNEVFEIGDVINFTGTIYNSGGNGGGTYTDLYMTYKTGSNTSSSTGRINVNVPVKKTVSFSGFSLKISLPMCVSNTKEGQEAGVRFYFHCTSSSTSQVFDLNSQIIKINDPTIAPRYILKPNDIVDSTGYSDRFGGLVQKNSNAMLSIDISDISTGTEPNVSGRAKYYKVVVKNPSGETAYDSGQKYINAASTHLDATMGSLLEFGEYTCELSLIGEYGKTGTSSVSFSVLPCESPKLFLNGTSPVANRFRAEQDDIGGIVYTEAPDGTKALLSFVGNIQAFSGLNTYEISVKYGIENEEMIDLGVFASGTDVDDLAFTYQDTIELLKDDTFSIDNRYQFDITIKDYFGQSATITGYLEKAVFRVRVHENGVAVGMNTTGTAEQKKFEVAENYTTHLYGEAFAHGGIAGVTNYPVMNEGAVYPPTNNNEEVYEREELTGGTWIDGKPIYRYTWMGVSSRSGSQGGYGNIPGGNPETVIRLYGTFKRPSDNAWFAIPNIYYGSLNYAVNMRTNEDGGLTVGFGSAYDGTKSMILVVEYTKK